MTYSLWQHEQEIWQHLKEGTDEQLKEGTEQHLEEVAEQNMPE